MCSFQNVDAPTQKLAPVCDWSRKKAHVAEGCDRGGRGQGFSEAVRRISARAAALVPQNGGQIRETSRCPLLQGHQTETEGGVGVDLLSGRHCKVVYEQLLPIAEQCPGCGTLKRQALRLGGRCRRRPLSTFSFDSPEHDSNGTEPPLPSNV